MRKKVAILITGMGLLIVATVCVKTCIRPEPRFNGKTISELSRLTALSPDERRMFGVEDEEVRDALSGLRMLGPQAEEALIRQMQTRDTIWRRNYRTIRPRLPRFAKTLLPPYVNAAYRRQTAVTAIGKLGPLSARTEHALVVACHDPDPLVRELATVVLGYRGSRSSETVQAIAEAMRDPQLARRVAAQSPGLVEIDFRPKTVEEMAADLSRPFREARYQAACSLGDLGPKALAAIPALITACEDSEDQVRISCARALGWIGAGASNAIPALRKMLKDESSFARSAAADAIQQIQHPLEAGRVE